MPYLILRINVWGRLYESLFYRWETKAYSKLSSVQVQVGLTSEQLLLTIALYRCSSCSQKSKLKHYVVKMTQFNSTWHCEDTENKYSCAFPGRKIWQYIPARSLKLISLDSAVLPDEFSLGKNNWELRYVFKNVHSCVICHCQSKTKHFRKEITKMPSHRKSINQLLILLQL